MATDITPRTWTDGNLEITTANLNTEIRDSYLLLLNPPTCVLERNAAFSIPTGASQTVIPWDSLLFDTEDPSTPMYSSVNPSRVTIRTAGWYECMFNIGALLGSNIIQTYSLRVNGVTVYTLGSSYGIATTTHKVMSCSMLLPFNATDYVEVTALHNSASAQSLEILGNSPNFMVYRRRGL